MVGSWFCALVVLWVGVWVGLRLGWLVDCCKRVGGWWVGWLSDGFISWSVWVGWLGRSAGWLVACLLLGWLFGCLGLWFGSWLFVCFVGWLVGRVCGDCLVLVGALAGLVVSRLPLKRTRDEVEKHNYWFQIRSQN